LGSGSVFAAASSLGMNPPYTSRVSVAGLELADQVADDSAPRSGKSTLRDNDSPAPGSGG
jgi:hypothetical protein